MNPNLFCPSNEDILALAETGIADATMTQLAMLNLALVSRQNGLTLWDSLIRTLAVQPLRPEFQAPAPEPEPQQPAPGVQ